MNNKQKHIKWERKKNPPKIRILLKKDGMEFTAPEDKMKILLDNFIQNNQGYQYQARTNITTK